MSTTTTTPAPDSTPAAPDSIARPVNELGMVSIMVPASIAVPHFHKRETIGSFPVNVATMPDESIVYLFNYGLRQSVNDSMADADSIADARKRAESRIANIMSGNVGKRGRPGGAVLTDPVEIESDRIARDDVKKALRAAPFNVKKPTEHPDYEALVAARAADESVIAAARDIVAARARVRPVTPAGGGDGPLTIARLFGGPAPAPVTPDSTPGTGGDNSGGADTIARDSSGTPF